MSGSRREDVASPRHGQAAVRLTAIKSPGDRQSRRKMLEAVRRAGAAKAIVGVNAARSQDFLYGDDGLSK